MDKNLRPYFAELIGTFALVFVSAGVVITGYLTAAQGTNGQSHLAPGAIIGIALAQGLILAAALAVTVPISGGFLNPAITLMLYVFKRFDLGKTALLILTQFIGAALAGCLLRLIFSMNENLLIAAQLGTPHVDVATFGTDHLSIGALLSGLGVELVGTLILAAIIFAGYFDPRVPKLLGRLGNWLVPLWIGLAQVALTLAFLVWTGASFNPIRYFGTAVWEKTIPSLAERTPSVFADHMVYWIGPVLGALIAGAAYIYLILPEQEDIAPAPPITAAKRTGAASNLSRSK